MTMDQRCIETSMTDSLTIEAFEASSGKKAADLHGQSCVLEAIDMANTLSVEIT